MRSGRWLALVVGASLYSAGSQAAGRYSQTTANTGIAGLGLPVAVQPTIPGGTTSDIGGPHNCLASQGCMGINISPANPVPVQDFTLNFQRYCRSTGKHHSEHRLRQANSYGSA